MEVDETVGIGIEDGAPVIAALRDVVRHTFGNRARHPCHRMREWMRIRILGKRAVCPRVFLSMRKSTVYRVLVSPWMIVVVLAVGWGPALVADCVRVLQPDQNVIAECAHFVMHWIVITACCSVIALILILLHTFTFFFRLLGDHPEKRR